MLKSHYDIQPLCPKQEPDDDDDAGAFFCRAVAGIAAVLSLYFVHL